MPLLGYGISKGRCAACEACIDPFHSIGEGLGALVLATCLIVLPWPSAPICGVISLLLLMSALIDAKTLRLPDFLTLAIALCSIILAATEGRLISGLIAAMAAFLILYGLKVWIERQSDKTMFGMGDVKLIAALALWLGTRTPLMLALAALMGLIVVAGKKDRPAILPFGPMIATSAFVIGVFVPQGW